MNKIYILSSERSGSNLLRTLLGNHKNIEAPVAPHFLNFFGQFIHLYGDLTQEKNLKRCLNDFIANANHPYHDWKLNTYSNELIEKYKPKNLVTITNAIYSENSNQKGKSAYVSKGIQNFNYASDVINEFSDTKFIYLHRDPRDHAASWLRTPISLNSPYEIIKKWVKEQQICLFLKSSYPNYIHRISYESLIENTAETMSGVLKFINMELDSNCFQTQTSNTESNRNILWKNLSKPIDLNNKKKFLIEMQKKDIRLIESIAKVLMIQLGYNDFASKADWNRYNSYQFHFNDTFRRFKSRVMNRKLRKNNMQMLMDKFEFQKQLRHKLIDF